MKSILKTTAMAAAMFLLASNAKAQLASDSPSPVSKAAKIIPTTEPMIQTASSSPLAGERKTTPVNTVVPAQGTVQPKDVMPAGNKIRIPAQSEAAPAKSGE